MVNNIANILQYRVVVVHCIAVVVAYLANVVHFLEYVVHFLADVVLCALPHSHAVCDPSGSGFLCLVSNIQ